MYDRIYAHVYLGLRCFAAQSCFTGFQRFAPNWPDVRYTVKPKPYVLHLAPPFANWHCLEFRLQDFCLLSCRSESECGHEIAVGPPGGSSSPTGAACCCSNDSPLPLCLNHLYDWKPGNRPYCMQVSHIKVGAWGLSWSQGSTGIPGKLS